MNKSISTGSAYSLFPMATCHKLSGQFYRKTIDNNLRKVFFVGTHPTVAILFVSRVRSCTHLSRSCTLLHCCHSNFGPALPARFTIEHTWQDAFSQAEMEFLDPFEDDVVVVCFAEQTRAAAAAVSAVAGSSGGALVSSAASSRIGRMPNVDRGFEEAWKRLQDDYLGSNPRYSEKTFARRFRMSRATFETIYTALSSRGEFQRRPNALGELGLFPA